MLPTKSCPTRTPSLWPYLLLCAGVALVVSLGDFHRRHQGDSLLPILVSLQRWTPFFWEQDRVGMLVPLLALPIRDPLLNLVAQETLNVFATLAAMFLLARYMLRDETYPLAGTLSAAACLALAPVTWFFTFAVQFFGVLLALGLGGLVLAEAGPERPRVWIRWFGALGLIVLAHWVYTTTALLLGPLVVARFCLCRKDFECLQGEKSQRRAGHWSRLSWIRPILAIEVSRQLLLLGLGLTLGYAFLRLAPRRATNLEALRPDQWPESWHGLLNNGWGCLAPHHWPYFLLGTAVAGLLALGAVAGRRQAGVACRSALALGGAAIVYFLFMGTRQWVQLNLYDGRYIFPSCFLLQGALAIVAVGPLAGANRRGGETENERSQAGDGNSSASMRFRVSPLHHFAAATLILLLAAISGYHLPSLAKVRRDLDQTLGRYTADILAARCTHVAGDYWKVWPAVFHANWALHERGESRTIWGISVRAGPTRAQWKQIPLEEIRVAIPLDDIESAKTWLRAYHFPDLVVVEKRPTIYVFRPAAAVAREQQRNSGNGHDSADHSAH